MTTQPDWLKGMHGKASEVNERISGGGAFLKRLNLTGKNAIVKPGGQVILRLLPRWDIKDAYLIQEGKMVHNPEYKTGPVFFIAFEHWMDGEGGNRIRVWCPLTAYVDTYTMNITTQVDAHKICPFCQASDQLKNSPDSQDKKYGAELAKRESFLFNAVARDPITKRRMVDEHGLPDIRVLPAQGTIFVAISNIMTGGGEAEFGRGDITHPKTGYDIKLTRPQGSGQRWTVEVAPNSSPMISDEERPIWKDWTNQLVDLKAWVMEEMKSYEELAKIYYGDQGAPVATGTAPAVDPAGFDLPASPPAPLPQAAGPPADPTTPGPAAPPFVPPTQPAPPAAAPPTPPAADPVKPPTAPGSVWGLD